MGHWNASGLKVYTIRKSQSVCLIILNIQYPTWSAKNSLQCSVIGVFEYTNGRLGKWLILCRHEWSIVLFHLSESGMMLYVGPKTKCFERRPLNVYWLLYFLQIESPTLVRQIDWAQDWPDWGLLRTVKFYKNDDFETQNKFPKVQKWVFGSFFSVDGGVSREEPNFFTSLLKNCLIVKKK